MSDLATIMWKEWRSTFAGRARRQVLLVGGMLAFWAVAFPIQMGSDWVTDPVPIALFGIAMPVVMVGIIVPDAIAGERERHTLRTLLASRLPDRAILYGKLTFAVAFGWLAAPLILAIALVTVNIAAGADRLLLYDPGVLVSVLVAGLLVSVLTGGIGTFVSLRARTAQEAQQVTVFAMMLPMMVITAAAFVLVGNPQARAFLEWLGSDGARYVGPAAMLLLALVDVVVIWAADRRFRRGRLIVA